MTRVRVYLPLTAGDLRVLASAGDLDEVPRAGYAVTTRLERSLPGCDEEELEYAALLQAAAAAATVRGADRVRRVVGAADLDHDWLADVGEPLAQAAVTVTAAVPLRRFVSFHVDEEPHGSDADLLWHDVTELATVRELVG